jgi:hypothetical protein
LAWTLPPLRLVIGRCDPPVLLSLLLSAARPPRALARHHQIPCVLHGAFANVYDLIDG